MNTNDLYNKLNELKKNDIEHGTYLLFNYENIPSIYYGLDDTKNLVFAVDSTNSKLRPIQKITKELSFSFNAESSIVINNVTFCKYVHIILCKSNTYSDVIAFLKLSQTFIDFIKESKDSSIISEFFIALTNLFANKEVPTKQELRGFFTELYLINYLFYHNINILKYWQKQDKMKFDFMINETKRIEVKSTTNESRIHHFKHAQLLTRCYDIKIASFLIRETNEYSGLSLDSLLSKLYARNIVDYYSNIYIMNFIKNIPEDYIKHTYFDEIYLKNNLKFYDVNSIPKYSEDEPDGVTKTEYDSDLSNAKDMSFEQFLNWLE